ncbi:hypothetical protein D3C80_2053240 [compost metagenome]
MDNELVLGSPSEFPICIPISGIGLIGSAEAMETAKALHIVRSSKVTINTLFFMNPSTDL